MDLFPPDPAANLLPCDGTVHYLGRVLGIAEAWKFHDALLEKVPWKQDEAIIFGRRVVTAREVAWYGDASFRYTYSGTTKEALPWNEELRALKELIEQRTATSFNSCLLNLYHDGSEGMAWHSDDEKSLGRHATIASLSLGAERKFCLKHKRRPASVSMLLEHGSLLVMKDATQTNWLHSIPKSKRILESRINLTFRTMIGV